MIQPGTGAWAMEKPFQPLLVHVSEDNGGKSTKKQKQKQKHQPPANSEHLGLLEPELRTLGVLTFPIVAGSDVRELLLKEKHFSVRDLIFTIDSLFLTLQ
jgi:hypothetical protein